jgi:hypothetical protein
LGGITASAFGGVVCAKAGDRTEMTVHARIIAKTTPANGRSIPIFICAGPLFTWRSMMVCIRPFNRVGQTKSTIVDWVWSNQLDLIN